MRLLVAEIIAAHTQAQVGDVHELLAREVGPATPKIDVRAVVFQDDAILLVKEPADGAWSLPGGWADVNESAAEAVVREVYEESGYRTRAVKLLALYDRDKHNHPPILYAVYKIYLLCAIVDFDATHVIDSAGAGFFREDAIPPLSLTRVTPAQITRFFEHMRHPEWPADFD